MIKSPILRCQIRINIVKINMCNCRSVSETVQKCTWTNQINFWDANLSCYCASKFKVNMNGVNVSGWVWMIVALLLSKLVIPQKGIFLQQWNVSENKKIELKTMGCDVPYWELVVGGGGGQRAGKKRYATDCTHFFYIT